MTKQFIRYTILAAAVALLAAPALAQEQVTVVQRDGEKVTGQFEDWNHNTDVIYVRVSPSDQRIIPLKNVLAMEVGGDAASLPAKETEMARGAEHVLVTKSGDVLKGQLVNIEGGVGSSQTDEPRTVSFRAETERRFPMKDVARLYLGNYPMPTTAAAADLPPGAVRLPATEQWVATNIVVRRGDRVQFSVNGEIQLSADEKDKAAAAGSLIGRKAPNAPAPQHLAGALLGRIGGGAPFAIGNQTDPLPMPEEGALWIGVNDDVVADNKGEFIVTIRVIRGS